MWGRGVGVRGLVTHARRSERESRSINRSRAREMRHKPVAMEKLFWDAVRDRKLDGHKFKRQYLVGPYIVDFVCIEKKLIVELDGALHANRVAYEMERDAFLSSPGFEVFRVRNEELAGDMAMVMAAIRHALNTPSP